MQHLFYRLTNLSSSEYPRAFYNFFIKLFIHAGHIVGHAVLIAIVATRIGIWALPIFLLIAAATSMFSTFVLWPILSRYHKQTLLIFLAITASICLLFASILGDSNVLLFLLLPFIASAVFLSQLTLTLNLFIEDQFTPIEAEHSFPIIESAELTGILLGGSIITLFSNSLMIAGFFAIWALLILLATILVSLEQYIPGNFIKRILINEEESEENKPFFLNEIIKHPLLRYISIFILLQFMIIPILEFEYTKSLVETYATSAGVLHGLGTYMIIVATIGIALQLIAASRLLKTLGIVRTILINPILMILPALLLNFNISTQTIAFARGTFDISRSIGANAYFTMFYIIPAHIRDRAKPFIEGFIGYFGIFIGTLIILISESVFSTHEALRIANLLILAITFGMIFYGLHMRRTYTNIASNMLQSKNDIERQTAIEVLSDHGHTGGTQILIKQFKKENNPIIRKKIIQAIGHRKSIYSTGFLAHTIETGSTIEQIAALRAISNFKKLSQEKCKYEFTRTRIFNICKKIFNDKNTHIETKRTIIKMFITIELENIDSFLIESLNTKNIDILIEIIETMRTFKDPGMAFYLYHFLQHQNPRVRAKTASVLWQFLQIRGKLKDLRDKMLKSNNHEEKLAAIEMIGDTNHTKKINFVRQAMTDNNPHIRLTAATSAAKLGNHDALNIIAISAISGTITEAQNILDHICHLPQNIQNKFYKLLRIDILNAFAEAAQNNSTKDIERLVKICEIFNDDFDLVRLAHMHKK